MYVLHVKSLSCIFCYNKDKLEFPLKTEGIEGFGSDTNEKPSFVFTKKEYHEAIYKNFGSKFNTVIKKFLSLNNVTLQYPRLTTFMLLSGKS